MTPTPVRTTRPYVMRRRAGQVERTREKILDATVALAFETPVAAITLPAVARRADTTVQTVLRQFGNRDGLFDAALEWATPLVLAERPADPADLVGSLDLLVEHYETRGDGVLLLLGQESWEPVARRVTDAGRRLHREWVRRLAAPTLAGDPDEAALTDLLVVATDVYTWKLLRRDRGLTPRETRDRMHTLIGAILSRR